MPPSPPRNPFLPQSIRGQARCWDNLGEWDKMTNALKSVFLADQWFNDNRDTLILRDGLAWKGTNYMSPPA